MTVSGLYILFDIWNDYYHGQDYTEDDYKWSDESISKYFHTFCFNFHF